jgi:anaerobic ribonucleoside-triphosphate reductase activating protein
LSILVPVISTGITLTEIPDRIAYFIELGNCSKHCPNCHSPYLSDTVISPPDLAGVERMVEHAAERGADAIVLMGGTTNGISDDDLITICQTLGSLLPLGLYSGRDDEERDKEIARRGSLHWLKTGSYQEELGGLDSPRTNQRFYELEARFVFDRSGSYIQTDTIFHDITHLFQKGVTCT